MNEKTIAAIALRDGAFSSFQETLKEAARCLETAAAQGARLAVLPETINLLHRKDTHSPIENFAFEDWQRETALLVDAAVRSKIALILPLLVREDGALANRFFVISDDGSTLGSYQKRAPAAGERASGVKAGDSGPILWEGLRIGGAICVDVYYPQHVFDPQMEAGADLFVIPSYTPAGAMLDFCALTSGVPVVLAYSPWCRILDRDMTELAAGGYRSETLRAGYGSPAFSAKINFDAVTLFADFNQEKISEVERRYGRDVRVRFNQPNCIFTLESRSADLTVQQVMREFGLVSRRDHFAQQAPGAAGKKG